MNPVDYFSASVSEADDKFQQACQKRGLTPQFYRHTLTSPAGEALNMGACYLGPADAAKRLLIISGTHGIEGYAGAGIQTGWLQQCADDVLPPDTGVLMVHMLNPWGMAWNRRENEDNVDLFRNLLYADHPSEPDPLYDAVDDVLDLEHWDSRDLATWQQRAAPLVAKHGQPRLIAAIRRGQHHRPKSMTFHGSTSSWSKRTLETIVRQHLHGARHVAVIDIHTGFGGYGEGLVMSYDPPGSEKHQRVSEWFAGAIYTPGGDADIPDHRVRLPYEWIEPLIGGGCVTAEILEFGTFDPAEIGEIFNANHHYHVYGDPLSAEGLEWGRRYRRYCYPEEDAWKGRVWERGREVIEKTLQGVKIAGEKR